jgi:glycogen debranching enzyme
VLHEAWKWLGERELLTRYRDVALRCLEWIDRYGDLDGDGFQEYQTRSPKGYENMGWKDSGHAVVYPDGTPVPQPKALCELQGYVFDARMRMAEVFDALGEPDRAAALRAQAGDLRRRFEEAFWCEPIGSYAFGLDREKRPIETVVSNPGHLLWSGMIDPGRARAVARRLLRRDMWSGWGIRTLSAENPAYNPYLYQLGAVWPHDNGIIALGCRRYGLAEESARIARAVFDAASCFKGYRLPELFSGVPRQRLSFPVQYKQANTPQAWAAGSVFHFIQALLGLRADAPAGRLYVDPALPPWLAHVRLENLEVGRAVLDLRFYRRGGRSAWEVTRQRGRIDVVETPWRPWAQEPARAPERRKAAR